jgi:hypothetical protein
MSMDCDRRVDQVAAEGPQPREDTVFVRDCDARHGETWHAMLRMQTDPIPRNCAKCTPCEEGDSYAQPSTSEARSRGLSPH